MMNTYLVKDTITGYKVLEGIKKADKFHVNDKSIVNLKFTTKDEIIVNSYFEAQRKAEMLNFYTQ